MFITNEEGITRAGELNTGLAFAILNDDVWSDILKFIGLDSAPAAPAGGYPLGFFSGGFILGGVAAAPASGGFSFGGSTTAASAATGGFGEFGTYTNGGFRPFIIIFIIIIAIAYKVC